MCIIVDVNVFSSCFDANDASHNDFKPVLDWIIDGRGKIVYGGSKYKNEMMRATKYLRFIANLESAGKVVKISDDLVDGYMEKVKKINQDPDFDDPHLVAIVLASECRIICSNDKRAYPYLKNPVFYSRTSKRPKIYRSKRNSSLLNDSHIADVCRPCCKLKKSQVSTIQKADGR